MDLTVPVSGSGLPIAYPDTKLRIFFDYHNIIVICLPLIYVFQVMDSMNSLLIFGIIINFASIWL